MADEVQKLPYALSLNRMVQRKILDAARRTGMALPCKVVDVAGSIVTLSFEVDTTQPDGTVVTLPRVTVPMFGPEYIRYPTQIGDTGVVFPASVRLGGITGLGAGLAKLFSVPGNLSTLVFFPIASKNWSAVDDPNKLVMYGPNGFELRDTNSKVQIIGDAATGVITLKNAGGAQITLNDDGTITLNGIVWGTHEHTGVAAGSAKSGGPVSP